MTDVPATERLDSAAVLERHLAALLAIEPRFVPIAERVGPIELRPNEPGFPGLLRIISGQKISVASARAIWQRVDALPAARSAAGFLCIDEAPLRAAGFSASKVRTSRILAEAIVAGDLDLEALPSLSAEAATAALTRHKGIGRWTAEIYLMFCLGHPDVFPSGDLAVQKAAQNAFGLPSLPTVKEMDVLAARWSPYRHTATLLLWKYYLLIMRRAGGIAL